MSTCPTCGGSGRIEDDVAPAAPSSPRSRADAWNRTYPVGTLVWYWTGARTGPGKTAKTRAPAQTLAGHTPVVWVEGEEACISLDHVEAVS
jgi:hypothetical protein